MAADIRSIVHVVGEPFVQWLLRSSWQAALVVALVLLLRRAASPVLGPRWRHALWGLVLLRVILPVAPQSRFSVMQIAHGVVAAWDAMPFGRSSNPATTTPAAAQADPSGFVIRYGPLPSGVIAPQESLAAPVTARGMPLSPWLVAIWFFGVLVLGARLLVANVAFSRRCARSRSTPDQRLISLLDDCRRAMRMSRASALWITDTVAAPAVAGLFRPRLLLPPTLAGELSAAQLRLVFLHELAHVKCHDIAIDWLWTAVNVLHWFNPALWLVRPRWRADRELARDAMVLSVAGAAEAESYGQMILRLVQSASATGLRPMVAPGLVGMADGRSEVRRRIHMIARFNLNRRWMSWIGLALFALAGCAALTDPHEAGAAKAQAAGPSTQHSDPAADQVESREPATPTIATTVAAPVKPADEKVQAALDRNMPELNFSAVPLNDAIDFLRDVTNTNIFVNWKALEGAGVDRGTIVTARLRDVKFSKALKMILKDAGGGNVKLAYEVDDGVISISTDEDLAKNVTTRVYDIRDLMIAPDDDMPGEFVGGGVDKPNATSQPATQQLSPREQTVKSIILLIQEAVGPDTWKDKGGTVASIREIAGQLVITQTPENQSAIEVLLGQLRENRGLQVVVESRFLNLNPQELAGVSQKLRERLIAASGGSGIAESPQQFLPREEVDELLRAAQGSRDVTTLFAPRVTLFNGQRAYVILGSEMQYVASMSLLKTTDGKSGYEPEVRQIQVGLLFDVQATLKPDHRAATVLLRPIISRLDRMISEPAPGIPAEAQAFVQRPVLTVRQLRTTTTVPDGQTLLVGGFQETTIGGDANAAQATQPVGDPAVRQLMNASGGRKLFLLVRPTIVIPTERRN